MQDKEKTETEKLIKLLNDDSRSYSLNDFRQYIVECGGISKLKKESLDKILPSNKYQLLYDDYFMGVYKLVSDNKSGKLINTWTWIAGSAAVISVLLSIASLLVSCLKP